jgi:TorA maturation chaperone TorD
MELNKIANMNTKRAQIYQTFISVFMYLPDEKFLEHIYAADFGDFLEQHKKLQYPTITNGVDLIRDFLRTNKTTNKNELIENLAVDRTRLIRMPHGTALKAPYESQYHKEMKTSASLKRITAAYKKAGFVPEGSKESPDYLYVELDFMRVLSNRIASEPAQEKLLLKLQKEFFEAHLGKWFGLYVDEAAIHAETEFYKGLFMMLKGFLEVENMYLQSL